MRTFLILIASSFLAACNYYEAKGLDPLAGASAPTSPGPTDPGTPPAPPTFATVQARFLQPYCLRCHQGDAPAGGLSVEAYQPLIDEGWVAPNDPDNSILYTITMAGDMPKRGAKPSTDVMQMVREWIENGALER